MKNEEFEFLLEFNLLDNFLNKKLLKETKEKTKIITAEDDLSQMMSLNPSLSPREAASELLKIGHNRQEIKKAIINFSKKVKEETRDDVPETLPPKKVMPVDEDTIEIEDIEKSKKFKSLPKSSFLKKLVSSVKAAGTLVIPLTLAISAYKLDKNEVVPEEVTAKVEQTISSGETNTADKKNTSQSEIIKKVDKTETNTDSETTKKENQSSQKSSEEASPEEEKKSEPVVGIFKKNIVNLTNKIKKREGYRPFLYQDENHVSFGYGYLILWNTDLEKFYSMNSKQLRKEIKRQASLLGFKITEKEVKSIENWKDVIKLISFKTTDVQIKGSDQKEYSEMINKKISSVKERLDVVKERMSKYKNPKKDWLKNDQELVSAYKSRIKKLKKLISTAAKFGIIKLSDAEEMLQARLLKQESSIYKVHPKLDSLSYLDLNGENHFSNSLGEIYFNVGLSAHIKFQNYTAAMKKLADLAERIQNKEIKKDKKVILINEAIKEIKKLQKELPDTKKARWKFYFDKFEETIEMLNKKLNENYTLKNAFNFLYT